MHCAIYYISPVVVVAGLKTKSRVIAYAPLQDSSNQFALGFPTLLECSILGADVSCSRKKAGMVLGILRLLR